MSANGTAARDELRRLTRLAVTAARDPIDAAERVRERFAVARQKPHPPIGLRPDLAWEERLHEFLGTRWPCDMQTAFGLVWQSILKSLELQGLEAGRGAYCGWDDADPGFARTAWCLTRHAAPSAVVETGVARGLTSRVILEALTANGAGRLCSIDLPPAAPDPFTARQRAAAVSERLKRRWTLVHGSSRRRLPRLLDELGRIDLFVHDSRHSHRNVCFELTRAWGALREGGFLLVDDVHHHDAFLPCVERFGEPPSIVCPSDDRRGLFGVIRKPPSPEPGAVRR